MGKQGRKNNIERRRKELRNGHSVKCWKNSRTTCTCSVANSRPGESKYA